MMRPLYIDGVSGCRVVFDDPALRVIVPEQADQLFPLQRISRVVCQGCVDWSMSALLVCADKDIQLLFLKNNGEIRARWLSWSGERQSLTQRLVDLLSRANGPELYTNWYLSMEKLAARSFARRIGLSDWRENPVAELRQRLKISLGSGGWQCAQLLQSILYGELLIWLPKYGFERDNEVLISAEFDLAADLSKLLMWDCYLTLLKRTESKDETSLQSIAALFQLQNDRCYSLFRSSINKLHQFLLKVS
ncbi:CRISPR-associated endonuclease Cas1 [Nitrosomonas ureae]|uniref:CRISPR associated protein Cas1 n=1 Tax=Nitrosomonas ureae TaxID=44577 RepID=A0A1H8ZHJ8_9PROT|nr:CRISPR-associated endonuclease Cas1 [Nitrosomonas ureae]SDT87323.1 CRISPR associated protein Cas1 [Nitrosomonas ureae]SEP63892.1 CRISPR associated protein Cas1 [Nitrosomonas ureae]